MVKIFPNQMGFENFKELFVDFHMMVMPRRHFIVHTAQLQDCSFVVLDLCVNQFMDRESVSEVLAGELDMDSTNIFLSYCYCFDDVLHSNVQPISGVDPSYPWDVFLFPSFKDKFH